MILRLGHSQRVPCNANSLMTGRGLSVAGYLSSAGVAPLNCNPPPSVPVIYTGTQSYTATCPDGFVGSEVTAERTMTSNISQEDADALALEAAMVAAQGELVCEPFMESFSSTQFFTAVCPGGTIGDPVERSATRISYISQEDADALALADATAFANEALVCVPVGDGCPVGPFSVSLSIYNSGTDSTATATWSVAGGINGSYCWYGAFGVVDSDGVMYDIYLKRLFDGAAWSINLVMYPGSSFDDMAGPSSTTSPAGSYASVTQFGFTISAVSVS